MQSLCLGLLHVHCINSCMGVSLSLASLCISLLPSLLPSSRRSSQSTRSGNLAIAILLLIWEHHLTAQRPFFWTSRRSGPRTYKYVSKGRTRSSILTGWNLRFILSFDDELRHHLMRHRYLQHLALRNFPPNEVNVAPAMRCTLHGQILGQTTHREIQRRQNRRQKREEWTDWSQRGRIGPVAA